MRRLTEKIWYFMRFLVPEWLLRFYETRKWKRGIAPIPLPDADSAFRVLITPARHAGQGKLWSDALDRLPDVSSRSVTVQNVGFGHDADNTVSWTYATLSRRWQRELRRVLAAHYTHILIEASLPPLGGVFGGDFRKQVTWLQEQGLRVGFIAHGSEIRLPSRHMESEEWSPFGASEAQQLTDALEVQALKNAELYREFGVPAFVSTAGLKADLPDAFFLGLTIDGQKFATETKPFEREKLVVCHISSHSVLKATTKLEPIIEKFEAEGLFEFRVYSGVPQSQVAQILAESDVVLDQFALGDYGVFACEGLAAGRLVLSHVSGQVRAEVENATGWELPIPEATLATLESRLRDIAEHREQYRDIAARGPMFVRRVHNGDYSAAVLRDHFLAAA